jgi:hypothetical protein
MNVINNELISKLKQEFETTQNLSFRLKLNVTVLIIATCFVIPNEFTQQNEAQTK